MKKKKILSQFFACAGIVASSAASVSLASTVSDKPVIDNSTSESLNSVLDYNNISQVDNINGVNRIEKVDYYNDNTNQSLPYYNNSGMAQYNNNVDYPDENALRTGGLYISTPNVNQAISYPGYSNINLNAESYNRSAQEYQTHEENYTKGDDVHLNQTGEPYHFQGTWPKVVPADSSVIDHSKKEEKIENVSNDNKSEKSEEKNTENVEKNLKEKGKTETIKGVKKETDAPPLAHFILGSLTTSLFWLIGHAIRESL